MDIETLERANALSTCLESIAKDIARWERQKTKHPEFAESHEGWDIFDCGYWAFVPAATRERIKTMALADLRERQAEFQRDFAELK